MQKDPHLQKQIYDTADGIRRNLAQTKLFAQVNQGSKHSVPSQRRT